jgi:hypothetical protein
MKQFTVRLFSAMKWALALVVLSLVTVWAQQSNVEPIQLPPIKTVTLENGLKVIVIEQPSLPIVQFSLRVRAGAIHEPTDPHRLSDVHRDDAAPGDDQ